MGEHPEEVTLFQFMLSQSVSGFGSSRDSIHPDTQYTCGRDSLHAWYNGDVTLFIYGTPLDVTLVI